jgi:hypothetical protein
MNWLKGQNTALKSIVYLFAAEPEEGPYRADVVDYLMTKPDINKRLTDFLVLNNSDEAKVFVKAIVTALIENPQPVFTESNYPGKNDGRPNGWWKDDSYIEKNFKMPSDSNLADPLGKLNSREKELIVLFPVQAIMHYGNSKEAFDKAAKLASNGTLTRAHNGKADAFRHAFWNAMDTAEFGDSVTKLFTDAHEWNSENHPLETQMDIFNNGVGRFIGTQFNILSSSSDISKLVITYIFSGGMQYLTPLADHDGNNILTYTEIKWTNQP